MLEYKVPWRIYLRETIHLVVRSEPWQAATQAPINYRRTDKLEIDFTAVRRRDDLRPVHSLLMEFLSPRL